MGCLLPYFTDYSDKYSDQSKTFGWVFIILFTANLFGNCLFIVAKTLVKVFKALKRRYQKSILKKSTRVIDISLSERELEK